MPELKFIDDSDLQEKAVSAWTYSCRRGGYERLEDIPTERFDRLPNVSNVQHQKDTARIAAAIVKVLIESHVSLNRDYTITGALCHDVGKPIEWKKNQQGIFAFDNKTGAGAFYGENPDMPSLEEGASYQIARHSMWGLHVAMVVGMPEHIAHIISAHSYEGDFLLRSPEAWVVKQADEIWWQQIGRQALEEHPGPIPSWQEGMSTYKRI